MLLVEGADGWLELRWASPGELLLVGDERLPVRLPVNTPFPTRISVVLENRLLRIGGKVRGLDLSAMRPRDAIELLATHEATVDTVLWTRPSYDANVVAAIARLRAPEITLLLDRFNLESSIDALAPLKGKVVALVLRIGPRGINAAALSGFTRLEVLDTQDADWGNSKLPDLPAVQQLSISDEAAQPVLHKLRALKHLRLHCSSEGRRALQSLTKLLRLETLELENCRVTDAVLEKLSRLPRLLRLSISDQMREDSITDRGLGSLKRFTSLEALELTSYLITDQGISTLAALGRLRHLELDGAMLSEASVLALAALARLEEVELTMPLGRHGLETISRWRKLRRLAVAVKPGTSLDALGKLNNLEMLHLHVGRTEETALQAGSLPALPKLRAMVFEGAIDTRGFDALARQPSLVSLNLGSSKITQGNLTPMARLPHLIRLDLGLVGLPNKSGLGELTRLRWLGLRASKDSENPHAKRQRLDIDGLVNLRHLSVRFCQCSLAGLGKLKNLETLDLYPAVDVSSSELFAALPSLRRLRHLELHAMEIGDADLPRLTVLKELQYLGLRDTRVTDRGLDHLVKLRELRVVDMVHSGISSEAAHRFHQRHGTAVVACCAGE